ncbi:hypothetical protein [Acetobacter conturbans]|uniref:DUF2628 domain-containing protein n=1 Tax=Acetobacter conturbans TaxID=1737472 RepID=A0ABX0K216_9PROT|nr:hypothetical protein [Acetobacter conturbans]NHN89295.1 hypothetical protein [Acetobacter conturbans]
MKAYSVWVPGEGVPERQRRKGSLPVLVPQKLQWSVLFFGGLALIWSGARITGGLALAASIVAGALLVNTWFLPALMIPARFALAAFSSEISEWELRLRGFVRAGVVVGPDRASALLRYMDRTAIPVSEDGSVITAIPDPFAVAARMGRA